MKHDANVEFAVTKDNVGLSGGNLQFQYRMFHCYSCGLKVATFFADGSIQTT